MFRTFASAASLAVFLCACEPGAGGGGSYEIDPPDWILGTWEDTRGEQWVFSSNDIQTTSGGILTSLRDSYDTILEIEKDDTFYVIEASLIGLPAEFSFERTSETTFTTSNVVYTRQ